jgi:hypothetical protein
VFVLVLRLLAVYLGTAAASLWLARRFVSPIGTRAAVLLALGPFLLRQDKRPGGNGRKKVWEESP